MKRDAFHLKRETVQCYGCITFRQCNLKYRGMLFLQPRFETKRIWRFSFRPDHNSACACYNWLFAEKRNDFSTRPICGRCFLFAAGAAVSGRRITPFQDKFCPGIKRKRGSCAEKALIVLCLIAVISTLPPQAIKRYEASGRAGRYRFLGCLSKLSRP